MSSAAASLVIFALATGAIGDLLLQVLVNKAGMGGPTGWGLKPYFRQHGSGEAICTAAGMLGLFYALYILLKLPLKWWAIALYSIVLDLVFRKFRLFQSLDGYYAHLNYFWSAIWAIIPMLIPFFLWQRFVAL